ncbi:MAG: leucyl/phenylalanyl-tRNA--protein transferase [Acidimicrobiia bacterium]
MPVEPPPSHWDLPDPAGARDPDVVAVGADLEPGTLLAAYRRGLFPMRVRRGGDIGWWSPDPRGILPLDALRVTKSLAKSAKHFEIRVDTVFEAVMRACADPNRPHGWIDDEFVAAYVRLHELGWAHSVEAWRGDELVGGLYGIAIGGFFAGESMFHRARDASKVALLALVDMLRDGGATLLDVQWTTEHLCSLGAVDVPRPTYLALLADALQLPLPGVFADATP